MLAHIYMSPTEARVDKGWFQEKIAAKKLSQRKLAATLEMDPSSLTLMLQGKRKMTNQEATQIGKALGYPVTEIMRRAGIDVRDDVRKVPIAGYSGQGSVVNMLPKGTHDMIVSPPDVPSGSYVLQNRVAGAPRDGWLMFVSGEQLQPDEVMGRFCLATIADGRMYIAIVQRGYKSGLHNLLLMGTVPEMMENQTVAWASPILWIKPV